MAALHALVACLLAASILGWLQPVCGVRGCVPAHHLPHAMHSSRSVNRPCCVSPPCRPAETIFPMPGDQLFASAHWEERLPLADVLDKAEVAFSGSGASSGDSSGLQRFSCCFHYDHVNMTLRAATAADGSMA
ncbi:hypothetical protein COO60DRAFT_1223847 [Scenedesmus sp. NREL 46B-D3]|nr:hypothetical protein COO60DRAFT_1223847 [Scenedesmus sp. NREL 46B-D3]